MEERDRSLLAQIEQDIIDRKVSIEDVLRKCIIMGGHARSKALKEWASQELRGYGLESELPPYRQLTGGIMVRAQVGAGIVTQQVTPMSFPESVRDLVSNQVPIRESISEVSKTVQAEGTTVTFALTISPVLAQAMDKWAKEKDPYETRYQHILQVYWEVSLSSLHGLVDQVWTVLATFVSELAEDLGTTQAKPTSGQVDRAFEVAIHGDNANVVLQNQSTSGGSVSHAVVDSSTRGNQAEEQQSKVWAFLRKPGTVVVGLLTLVGTVAGLGQWLGWDWF